MTRHNAFTQALRGHAHPFICALDPFKLSVGDIVQRLQYLESHGATAAIIASTDDELYDTTVPSLLTQLRSHVGLRLIEHFRPHPQHGFRRACSANYVLMTTVANSHSPLYAGGAGDSATFGARERAEGRLIASRALVFGTDQKSVHYVQARYLPDDNAEQLRNYLTAASHVSDVYYLFSRARKLSSDTISAARNILGAEVPMIVSGCIRTPDDLQEAIASGATYVVIGSLLELGDWRQQLTPLLAAGHALRASG
jgi:heptaprenylglyceryl phosphate synthase